MAEEAPILQNKQYAEATVFTAEDLLREARRQKSLPRVPVPRICVLDPDGDMVRWLARTHGPEPNPLWACYHTDLYEFTHERAEVGIIPCAVGALFAVLVAEELFACGCELLMSVTSAGQITPIGEPPYFILIEKAVRDEGTSYHYLPPADFSHLDPGLGAMLGEVSSSAPVPVCRGTSWTTDAPFRETETAIAHFRGAGIAAVEMESAALYAFAEARQKAVVCFAHVTNQMGRTERDFEKGASDGSEDAMQLVAFVARQWSDRRAP